MLMGGRHSNYETDFGAAGSERHRHRDGDDAGIRHTWLGDDAAMEHTALHQAHRYRFCRHHHHPCPCEHSPRGAISYA